MTVNYDLPHMFLSLVGDWSWMVPDWEWIDRIYCIRKESTIANSTLDIYVGFCLMYSSLKKWFISWLVKCRYLSLFCKKRRPKMWKISNIFDYNHPLLKKVLYVYIPNATSICIKSIPDLMKCIPIYVLLWNVSVKT